MKSVGTAISKVGQNLTTKVTLPLVAVGGIGVKSAMEQESAMQQVDNIYGKASKSIKYFAENTAIAYNMSTKEAYKYSQVYGNLIQSITDDEEENAQYTQDLLKASSVIASATGRSMEDVMDRIRSGLLGNTEAIEDLGVNVNVSMLESTDAFKKFAGNKSWNQLDFQTQQQIRLFGILEQTSKKYGDEVNQNTSTNVQGLSAKMENLSTTLGEKLLPYFNKIIDYITQLVNKFNNLNPQTQDLIVKIGLIVAIIGPALLILGKLITAGSTIFGGISKGIKLIQSLNLATKAQQALQIASTAATKAGAAAQWLLNAAMSANPITLVIAAIVALIAIFAVLWNKSEKFRNFWIELWEKVKKVANNAWVGIKNIWNTVSDWFKNNVTGPLKNKFSDMWNGLKTGASNAWSGIKSVFSTVGTFFKNTFTKAWTAVKNIFSTGGRIFDGIKDGIVSAFKNIVNAIIGGINKVIAIPFNAINNVLEKIKNVNIAGAKPFNNIINTISVPEIPKLAKGGIVDKATLAMIGEGKSAEAVVPLDGRLTKYLSDAMREVGTNNNIVVQFYPQKMTDAEMDRAFNYVERKFGMAY